MKVQAQGSHTSQLTMQVQTVAKRQMCMALIQPFRRTCLRVLRCRCGGQVTTAALTINQPPENGENSQQMLKKMTVSVQWAGGP